jgi:RNA polymerase sigma factor (sigma-70 family)
LSGEPIGPEPSLESLVERAKTGDRAALEEVVRGVQDRVYNLAVRMLWHPADAEDATQEILIRVVTNLASFRGESAFSTWVYRVAANHLLTTRKRRAEREELTFERFAEDLAEGLGEAEPDPAETVEERLLVEEVKIGCSQGMLLCLDRDHRLAYVLGEVFRLTGEEGAEILGISPAAFRQRLSRARRRLHGFMEGQCGIVNPANPCRCARRVETAVRVGRVDPDRLLFATHPARPADERTLAVVREMERLHSAADLLRGHPSYAAPETLLATIRGLLDGSAASAVLRSPTPDARRLTPDARRPTPDARRLSRAAPAPSGRGTGRRPRPLGENAPAGPSPGT